MDESPRDLQLYRLAEVDYRRIIRLMRKAGIARNTQTAVALLWAAVDCCKQEAPNFPLHAFLAMAEYLFQSTRFEEPGRS